MKRCGRKFSNVIKACLPSKRIATYKNASISLSGINRFDITVTEFQEVALLAQDGGYAPVLENGVVLDEISEQPVEGLPV